MAKKNVPEQVDLPELKLRSVKLNIVGDTPLICHAWSKKAKLVLGFVFAF